MLKVRFMTVSVLCVFTILLLGSMVYADWPPGDVMPVAGYALLDDSESYQFRSDGEGYYTDVHLFPENMDGDLDNNVPGEKVELVFDGTELEGVLMYLGKPEATSSPSSFLGEPPYCCSPRQSNFWFDVIKDGKTTSQYKNYAAALDILAYTDASKTTRRGTLAARGKYYLNDNIVRLAIRRWLNSSGSPLVHDLIFTIEPSETPCTGCGIGAVTQTEIDDFSAKDKDVDYLDALEIGTSICDLVIYRISFDNDFSISNAGDNTWTVSGSGKAHLGPLLSNGSMVSLVDYKNLSFSVTVTTTNPFMAPRRHNTVADTWGEIKVR